MTETGLTKYEAQVPEAWSPQQVLEQVRRIQDVMKVAMKEDEHYGVIPGTKKPSLLKPGAEKLCLTFRFSPEYEVLPSSRFAEDFIIYDIRCKLIHIPTGTLVGTGLGSCNSREEKYRWRTAARKCPECGSGAIIKGKAEFGGGWVCFKKKGGCGARFEDEDPRITEQPEGKVLNDNPWDQANTIEKMGCKRALVAAVLNATAASDIFTQDVEDFSERDSHTQPSGANGTSEKPVGAATQTREPQQQAQSAPPPRPQAPSSAAPSAGPVISEAQAKRLYAIAKSAGKSDGDIAVCLRLWGYEHSRDIRRSDYEAVCKSIESVSADGPPGPHDDEVPF